MPHTNHPFRKFSVWYEEARSNKAIPDASAMALSTASRHGAVSSRMVLLKALDQNGFIFYTNLQSRKSQQLEENQNAALCFYWAPMGRQIRVEGYCEPVTDKEADAYFASRPRNSQLGAWASKQSEEIESREKLVEAFQKYEKKFEGVEVPRPPHWSGWRLIPGRIEFWQEEPYRLHRRELYLRSASGWEQSLLQP